MVKVEVGEATLVVVVVVVATVETVTAGSVTVSVTVSSNIMVLEVAMTKVSWMVVQVAVGSVTVTVLADRVIVEGAMETPIHEQALENREATEQALA